MLSGIVFHYGIGGGSLEIKHRNFGCDSKFTFSNMFSNFLSHSLIKCTFYSIIQCPSSPHLSISDSARYSYPYPIEIFTTYISKLSAIRSTSYVGSTPGNNTKNTGVELVVSSYVFKMSKGICSMYYSPIIYPTKDVSALVMRSCRSARSSSNLWNYDTSLCDLG